MSTLFVSHGASSRDVAQKLFLALTDACQNRGKHHQVILDSRSFDPDAPFVDKIEEQLALSDILLVLHGKDQSHWQGYEVGIWRSLHGEFDGPRTIHGTVDPEARTLRAWKVPHRASSDDLGELVETLLEQLDRLEEKVDATGDEISCFQRLLQQGFAEPFQSTASYPSDPRTDLAVARQLLRFATGQQLYWFGATGNEGLAPVPDTLASTARLHHRFLGIFCLEGRASKKNVWFAWDFERGQLAVVKELCLSEAQATSAENKRLRRHFNYERNVLRDVLRVPMRTGLPEHLASGHMWFASSCVPWGPLAWYVDAFEGRGEMGATGGWRKKVAEARDALAGGDPVAGPVHIPPRFEEGGYERAHVLRYFASAARTLVRMHERGWWHLDVSPRNLLVLGRTNATGDPQSPTAMLCDLERGRRPADHEDDVRERAYRRHGDSTQYSSPELLPDEERRGQEELALTDRADVFSLACVVVDYLSPHGWRHHDANYDQRHNERRKFAKSEELRKALGDACARRLADALEYAPGERCSMRALADALDSGALFITGDLTPEGAQLKALNEQVGHVQRSMSTVNRSNLLMMALVLVFVPAVLWWTVMTTRAPSAAVDQAGWWPLDGAAEKVIAAARVGMVVVPPNANLADVISCSDPPPVGVPSKEPHCPEDTQYLLMNDATYYLDRPLFLRHATLIASAGVTIRVSSDHDSPYNTAIVVTRTARIEARGTSERPVTITSGNPTPGAWGGLVLLGNAGSEQGEVEQHRMLTYGPLDEGPNLGSGWLLNVQIEYGGASILRGDVEDSRREWNGLTLAGIDEKTVIDNVTVLESADDCVEIFGGSAHLGHVTCLNPGDDALDVDTGFSGRVGHLYAVLHVDGCSTPHGSDPSAVIAMDGNGEVNWTLGEADVLADARLSALRWIQHDEGQDVALFAKAIRVPRDVDLCGPRVSLPLHDLRRQMPVRPAPDQPASVKEAKKARWFNGLWNPRESQ